ncbi:Uncharacterized protein HZ326_17444 [Fusarium oxysporum f. sp. albedinis]|nr:Uncharacterized protein HZ326_17444 [Fusarium oxysporum f. sp. albedinis]
MNVNRSDYTNSLLFSNSVLMNLFPIYDLSAVTASTCSVGLVVRWFSLVIQHLYWMTTIQTDSSFQITPVLLTHH